MKKIVFFFAAISMMIANSANAQCDSSLSINISQWLICHDDSVKVTSPTGDIWTNSSFTSYHWVYSAEGSDDVVISSSTNVAWIGKPKAGKVSLTVTTSKGGCMYGETPLVDVAPKVQIFSSGLINNHDTLSFTEGGLDGTIYSQTQNTNCLSTYAWYNIQANQVIGSEYSVRPPAGTYTLKVMNNDNRPCATFSDTVTILISKPTSVEKFGIETLSVYPNPVIDFLNLDNIKDGTVVRVIDVSGSEIFNQLIYGGSTQIDSSSWSPGFYTLIVGDSIKKIIKN